MNSVPLRFWYLKTWFPISGAVWGRCGRCGFTTGRVVLEALRLTASSYIKFALCFVRVSEAVCCQLLLPRLCVVMSFYLSGTEKTK